MSNKYSNAFDRMTTRVKADPEVAGYEKILSILIVFLANLSWVTFALGYLIGNDWQAGSVFWLGTAWVVAVQVFWGWHLSKNMLAHHDLLTAGKAPRRPQDRLR